MKEIDLHRMKLHDIIEVKAELGANTRNTKITRVPGGWIYETYSEFTFVPYNNEFITRGGESTQTKAPKDFKYEGSSI